MFANHGNCIIRCSNVQACWGKFQIELNLEDTFIFFREYDLRRIIGIGRTVFRFLFRKKGSWTVIPKDPLIGSTNCGRKCGSFQKEVTTVGQTVAREKVNGVRRAVPVFVLLSNVELESFGAPVR